MQDKMTLEPFRSAMVISVDQSSGDTSLAVPSDIRMRSAQQRVIDQVQTTARRKSRYSSKSVSGLISPISPKSDSVFYDVNSPTTFKGHNYTELANGSLGSGFVNGTISKGSAQVNGHTKMQYSNQGSRRTGNISRTVSRRTSTMLGQRSPTVPWMPLHTPSLGYHSRVPLEGSCRIARGNHQASSRSVPDLSSRFGTQPRAEVDGQTGTTRRQFQGSASSPHMGMDSLVPMQMPTQMTLVPTQMQKRGALSQHGTTQTFVKRPASNQSNGDSKMSQAKTRTNSSGQTAGGQKLDISMSEAIQYLSSVNENFQLYGASFIQHSTYTDDKAKQQVFQLQGIPPLISLLQSRSKQLQKAASAALRNLVYRHADNKQEVQRCGGVPQVVQLLKDSQSEEIHKHLTGLLWNLSSAEPIKADLVKSSLPVLTENVVVPYTDTNLNNNMDPEIFYNTTCCLRNLSAAKLVNRQAMRKTRGLIDALVMYIQDCVTNDKPDDKSLENCVCVLHNLTYGLEAESPQLFTKLNALSRSHTTNPTRTAGPIGCFSGQSNKIPQEAYFDYPVIEENNPRGSSWLFHSRTLQTYLSLLRTSENQPTLEACCGAMQNLTASDGTVSAVLSQTIVQKLNGLPGICSLLKRDDGDLKQSSVSLLANMARYPRLHTNIARQALRPLTDFISYGVSDETQMDETMATACHTAHTLMRAETEMSKKLLSNSLINSLNNMSHNSNLPKSSKAAAVLLYNLWAERDFQNFLKKQGMHKRSFVNDITTAAHKSVVVID